MDPLLKEFIQTRDLSQRQIQLLQKQAGFFNVFDFDTPPSETSPPVSGLLVPSIVDMILPRATASCVCPKCNSIYIKPRSTTSDPFKCPKCHDEVKKTHWIVTFMPAEDEIFGDIFYTIPVRVENWRKKGNNLNYVIFEKDMDWSKRKGAEEEAYKKLVHANFQTIPFDAFTHIRVHYKSEDGTILKMRGAIRDENLYVMTWTDQLQEVFKYVPVYLKHMNITGDHPTFKTGHTLDMKSNQFVLDNFDNAHPLACNIIYWDYYTPEPHNIKENMEVATFASRK